MRFGGGGRSPNLEDRRGLGGRAGLGIGGTAVVLILSLLFGRNLFNDIGASPSGAVATSNGALSPADSAAEEPEVQVVSGVLDDVQQTWSALLPKYGTQYTDARLVLFRDYTPTGCGTGQTAMGPFYCPVDQKVYLDLGFFDELKSRFGAKGGDFAMAYVVAHEFGHHVQTSLGISEQVQRMAQQDPSRRNDLSVRQELQADCLAGAWAHAEQADLEAGDIDEALSAASAVGDDRIQQSTTGQVNPETWTHGSAEQRVAWFSRGYDSGNPDDCDTFAQ